jgi:hypothetical protein
MALRLALALVYQVPRTDLLDFTHPQDSTRWSTRLRAPTRVRALTYETPRTDLRDSTHWPTRHHALTYETPPTHKTPRTDLRIRYSAHPQDSSHWHTELHAHANFSDYAKFSSWIRFTPSLPLPLVMRLSKSTIAFISYTCCVSALCSSG